MREGQQTVLSMQNDYEGPPEDFAMVVPTPQVLEKDDVKTIEDGVFDTIDRLTAPRLVEYWEQNPCRSRQGRDAAFGGDAGSAPRADSGNRGDVDVEAKFDVGEYEVVVLSSDESSALEAWLQDNGYNIPSGADMYLQPYVQQGNYFFVAQVDVDKVEFQNGQAVLSPLRFHYQSQQFKLPVRMGLVNSQGQQDLIVNILAREQRYQVANYPNTTIPTNLRVSESVKENFPSFYRSLFERTLQRNRENGQTPVVTEYSWDASKCDPCPGPTLDQSDYLTLGADVISDDSQQQGRRGPRRRRGWTITRLHARYDSETLGEDLVFEKASAIRGGRGLPGSLQQGAQDARRNTFQGRYIITHPWEGPVNCDNPRYGRWGEQPSDGGGSTSSVQSALGQTNRSSSAEANVDLDNTIQDGEPETAADRSSGSSGDSGGGCHTTGQNIPASAAWFVVFILAGWRRYRHRRND